MLPPYHKDTIEMIFETAVPLTVAVKTKEPICRLEFA